jgi:uncharacterized protein
MSSLETIEEFLAHRRLAMVGLSRNPRDFSALLFRELRARGYDVVPVNPNAKEIQGQYCFEHVAEIEPPVEAALLMTSSEVTERVVEECEQAGIRSVWLYGAGKLKPGTEKAVQFGRDHGMQVVAGECPFMFLPGGGVHRMHGWWQKLTGKYPHRTAA